MNEDLSEHDAPKRERSTWTKVRRLLELMDLLRLRERTTRELAEWFGVPQRHIQRDLRDLEAMGAGVEQVPPHGYRLLGAAQHLRPVQALAVHMAARLLYHHAATDNQQYRLALENLAAQLPESVREIARRSTEDLRPQLPDDQAFEKVARAWFERRIISFEYTAPGSAPERRELAVYFVEVSRANLAPYVIGFERLKRGEIRTFKLSRMRFVTTLTDTYEIPPDFDPRAYLSDAWGVIGGQSSVATVTLRFAPEAAYRVLEGGYPNLTVEELGDAQHRVVVKVRAGLDNTGLPRELMPWILGWGPRVEVLAPQHVRDHWLKEVRETLRQYGGDTL